MSGQRTANPSYLDLKASESNDAEEEVDMSEEDVKFINDEGGEDIGDEGRNEGGNEDDYSNGEDLERDGEL